MRGLRVACRRRSSSVVARVATTGILVKEAAEAVDVPHALTRRVHGVRLMRRKPEAHRSVFTRQSFSRRHCRATGWLSLRHCGRARCCCSPGRGSSAPSVTAGCFASPASTSRHAISRADGAHSKVGRHFRLGRNIGAFLAGAEAEHDALDGVDGRFLHCFLDSRSYRPAISPAAPTPRHARAGGAQEGGRICGLPWRAPSRCSIHAGARVAERRVGRIPAGGFVRPWAAPGVLLVGDAAGMVSRRRRAAASGWFSFRLARQCRRSPIIFCTLVPRPEIALALSCYTSA